MCPETGTSDFRPERSAAVFDPRFRYLTVFQDFKMLISSRAVAIAFAVTASLGGIGFACGQYDAPADYYSTATGTGATLKNQLQAITTNGMTGVTYGNAREMLQITDRDPNNPNKVLLIYNRVSVNGIWDSGVTWAREHIWPQSRLGASADNNKINIASDLFNLRPVNPSINSSRSNNPFGTTTSSGGYGNSSGYWYPGDADAGDVARAQFYMATRYSGQLSLVNGPPTGLQMGDLSSLLAYHYRDVPDDFERRRNHAIYGLAGKNSPAINSPSNYKQRNRNPYVDHPEYVWSVFVDQKNDTRLSVGIPTSDGGSTANVNLGRVLRNAAVPDAQAITLNKAGIDGTYYSVTTTGDAVSSVNGRYNAFEMGSSGSRLIGAGLNTSTAVAGFKSGTIIIDNLDVTTEGGAGRGANDADDIINIRLSVLDASNSSFSVGNDLNMLDIDFGTVDLGDAAAPQRFSIFNLASSLGANLTASLDLDSIFGSGDTSVLTTNLTTFSNLAGGLSISAMAYLDTSTLGIFSASYVLNFSDEDLPGTIGMTELTLNITGSVVPEPSAIGGLFILASAALFRRRRA